MNEPSALVGGWDPVMERFAAELTEAAYPIALLHGVQQRWLEMELHLWHALSATVRKRGRHLPQVPLQRLAVPWEDFLAELTDAAYRTMLGFGVRGSFLEVELSLHQTFRTMFESKALAAFYPCEDA